MRPAAQVFYLAVFSLLGTSHAVSHSGREAAKLKSEPSNVCEFEPGAIVSDACASYNTLEGLNEAIHPYLHSITQNTDFFSHYRLNLYNKKCPFWSDENGMCGNVACAVNTLENEEDIPLVWRAKELGKLEGPTAQHPGKKLRQERDGRPLQGSLGENVDESCVVEYDDECDDRDYCVPEDESATAKGDYVSLVDNPERFTGYSGAGSQQVWEAIYRENCFAKPPKNVQSSIGGSTPFGAFGSPQQLQAANELRNVIKEQGVKQSVKSAIAQGSATARIDPVEFDDTCLEKRVFYRVVSGMHASISTHLCWDYLNQTTGQWSPNLACYEHRLHNFPDRISNIYFNYALILRAVGKIKQHVKDYSFCSEDPEQDLRTKNMVLRLASAIPSGQAIFDETVMFREPSNGISLKEDFRNRFRNVSRIMDCVGCDKCRLWGKLQTAGYGTALKVLFEFDENDSSKDPPLRRTELVALLNTMDRLSHSLNAIKEFRKMIDERDGVPTPQSELEIEPPKEVLETKKLLGKEEKVNEAEDDGFSAFPTREYRANMTVWEDAKAEADLVFRAWIYVLKSWYRLPGKALKILIAEISRLWDYWLGLPVAPRSWEIKYPRREEL
ncbi:endoplasmic oxidoreductin [Delitschia confertaspora ATCC 74209]|uniref:Endoplasmic oxidoreductin n=1 Tax=Delitschia confertaspora ATCC 74209 TaxID=1513339 RepID=A0A9P4JQX9_9PLEO|nr:endoplasmic oxidoreductin [Delitschia confertaspora ATCC 74209]